MSTSKITAIIVMLILGLASAVAQPQPGEVVRGYIESFKQKQKTQMLECLADGFFDDYKAQYLRTIKAYSAEKQKLLLRMFEIGRIEELTAMSGREIFSTFLDKPASESYWKGFDALDLVIEIETLDVSQDQATVRSWLSRRGVSGAKVETLYSLKRSSAGWKIERFTKRRIEPNKAPEPTPTSVTSPAAQEPRQP